MTLIELAAAVDLGREGNYIEIVTGLYLHRFQLATLINNFPHDSKVEVVSDRLHIKWTGGSHTIILKRM